MVVIIVEDGCGGKDLPGTRKEENLAKLTILQKPKQTTNLLSINGKLIVSFPSLLCCGYHHGKCFWWL